MGPLAALVVLLCISTPARAAEGCSGFRHLENGRTFFRYSGLLVIFRCHPGFKLSGYKTNSCVSGQWSRDPPVCVGSGCSNPGPLTHGTSSMNEDGSWAAFSCNSGFRLHGPSMLYCKGHSWNSTKPVCKEFDMMTSVSGVSVQKANTNQNLPAAAVPKTQQQSHYDTVANTPSKEARLKFGSLSGMPSQMSNSETNKVTDPKVQLQQRHIEFPGFKVKGGEREAPREARPLGANEAQGLGTGTGRHGTEAKASDRKSQKVDKDTESFASALHLFTAISSTSSLVSATGRPVSSPPSFPTWQTTAIIKHAFPTEVRFGQPVPIQDYVTPSGVLTGTSKTADEDRRAATGVQYPSASQTNSSSPTSSPASSAPSSSSPPPSWSASTSSRPISTTQSNMPTPDVALPSNTSVTRGASPHRADDVTTNTASAPPPLFPRLSRRPVCPYPPVPVGGTFFFFRNVENPGPRAYRHYIQYTCYPGYTLARGDVHSYCQQGGTWSGVTPVCLELTPCSVNSGGCSQLCSHSQHYNQSSDRTQIGTRCHCRPGFTLLDDGQTCRDIDECAVNRGHGPCMERCHNSPGSYRCSCTYGHILAGDGHSCIPECPPGYRKQPTTPENSTAEALKEECVDINECQGESVCEWQCVNLPGSHRCICPRGYTLQRDGQRCKDINECSRKKGGCSHLCVNVKGGYKCACPASHRLSPYSWKKCVPRKTAHPAG
ncbi:uncharacterized protein si:dkey-163f14.6 [Scophthalmus maximus]|uniref:uncharacterized protein si:dkey-163f14.6 n=1 Tax=Scophthalmus maximus TaxID=52904 RepID=UPI001FA8668D|nr:uncharacterized protein si:dkey-163f14.6 [Scophthalmus maximus]